MLILLVVFYHAGRSQAIRWVKKAGSSGPDYARSIDVGMGNIYIAGKFSNVITFDSAGTSSTLVSEGGVDLYVARLNCGGDLMWKNRIGGILDEAGFYGIITPKSDVNGNVYVTGAFRGTCSFTSTAGANQTLSSAGNNDAFLAKYDSSGVLQWCVSMGGTVSDEGAFIAINGSGQIITSGHFGTETGPGNVITFNSTNTTTKTLTSSGYGDIYLACYSPEGVVQWVSKAGGPALDVPSYVYTDHNNNIYISGNFGCCYGGTAYFGTSSLLNLSLWGGFIAKADPNGNWLWANGMGQMANEAGSRVVADNQGNVFFTGHYNASSNLSSSPPGTAVNLSNYGDFDIVLAAFNENGVLQWHKVLGGPGAEVAYGMLINAQNNLVLTGSFSNVADFSGPLLTSAGGSDIFYAEYNKQGDCLMAAQYGGPGNDVSLDVSMNPDGVIFHTGYFSGTASFGDFSLSSTGDIDSYIARMGTPPKFQIMATKLSVCGPPDSAVLFLAPPDASCTFQWLKHNSPIAGATNDSLVVTTAGAYSLVVTTSCNEKDTTDEILITTASLLIDAGSDRHICRGDSTLLTATGPGTVSWLPPTGLTYPDSAHTIATPVITTTYTLTLNEYGCLRTDSITVAVEHNTVSAGSDHAICPGDQVQLQASGGSWYGWTPRNTLNDSTLSDPLASPSDTTDYIVKSGTSLCPAYDTVRIHVIPVFAHAGNDDAICRGDSIQLSGTVVGTPAWKSGFISDTTILNPYAKPLYPMYYYLTATNLSCSKTDSVLIVVESPPAFVSAGSDKTVCLGDSVQLQATGGSVFIWNPKTYLNDPVNISPFSKPLDTITYIVRGGGINCVRYDTVRINVIPAIVNAGTGGTICPGDSIQLHGTGTGQLTWTPGWLNDPHIADPYATPPASMYYYLTATNVMCSKVDSVFVNVISIAPISAGADRTICLGDTIRLSASGSLVYAWSPKASLSDSTIADPVANPSDTTTYIVSATNSGCIVSDTVRINVVPAWADAGPDVVVCPHDSIQLHGSAEGPYRWKEGYLNDATALHPYAKPPFSMYYYLTVDNSFCRRTDSVYVKVDSVSAAFSADQLKGFVPMRISLSNLSHNASGYLWYLNNDINPFSGQPDAIQVIRDPGDHFIKLIATSPIGCTDSAMLKIQAFGVPGVYIPSAFTPDGDGINDVFRVYFDPDIIHKVNGTIWNRWGEKVFEFSYPDGMWWDGEIRKQPGVTDTYVYVIETVDFNGTAIMHKGTVTLLR